MFNFHVVIELHDGARSDEDSLCQWQCFDGARDTFDNARAACDEWLSRELANDWRLDCLTIWPADEPVDHLDGAEMALAASVNDPSTPVPESGPQS